MHTSCWPRCPNTWCGPSRTTTGWASGPGATPCTRPYLGTCPHWRPWPTAWWLRPCSASHGGIRPKPRYPSKARGLHGPRRHRKERAPTRAGRHALRQRPRTTRATRTTNLPSGERSWGSRRWACCGRCWWDLCPARWTCRARRSWPMSGGISTGSSPSTTRSTRSGLTSMECYRISSRAWAASWSAARTFCPQTSSAPTWCC